MMNKQNNIIQLSHYIEQEKKIVPIDFYAQINSLKHENILSKRFIAFSIDFFAVMLIKYAIDLSYALFIQNFYFFLDIKQQYFLSLGSMPFHLAIALVIFWTYSVFCTYTLEGSTFGKYAMKLRTINDDFIFTPEIKDFTPSIKSSLRRTFGYFVCFLSFGTFFSFSLFSEDQRGIPDYFSGTRTVSNEWLDGMVQYKEYDQEVINISIRSLKQVA